MRISRTIFLVTLVLLLGSSLSVLAYVNQTMSPQEQKRLDAQNIPAISLEQQALMDKEKALKAELLATYIPTQEPLNPYFIETAKKLDVDIEGLSDDEIMIKVKEAEVQSIQDHPVILTPLEQAEIDRLTVIKEAQSK